MEQRINNKFTISQLYKGSTLTQIEDTFNLTEDIIKNLDEYALKELCEGYSYDVDKLFLDIISESNQIINSGGGIQSFSFNYLTSLTNSLDEYLKKLSFAYFVDTCLSDFNIETYHLEWFNMISLYRNLCVLAARGHSKSYVFSFAYPLWLMYKYEGLSKVGKELTIITAEGDLAGNFVEKVKEEVENNPILKERIYPGTNSGKTWAKTTLQSKNGFELGSKGLNSSLRGLHTDVICDDILDESNFYNGRVREETKQLFNNVIMNIPLPRTGKVTVVGTCFHEQDLYAMLKKSPGWRVFEYPGIYPDGSVLSPERFSLKELIDKKKTIGSLSFAREILMQPISNTTSLFPFKIMKMNLDCSYQMFNNKFNIPFKLKRICFGVDLAVSANTDENSDRDYFVVAIIGLDENNRYWLLNYYRDKGLSYNKQMEVVKRLNECFKPDLIMVESNQYQKMFADLLRNNGLDNVQDRATTAKNKYDFSIGLPAVSVLFEQFRLKIPYAEDTYTRNHADLFMAEFNSMTFNDNKLQSSDQHDDICMASWLGITAINTTSDGITLSFLEMPI